jgi:hypothetical protein
MRREARYRVVRRALRRSSPEARVQGWFAASRRYNLPFVLALPRA